MFGVCLRHQEVVNILGSSNDDYNCNNNDHAQEMRAIAKETDDLSSSSSYGTELQ